MEIFGINLFNFKKNRGEELIGHARNQLKESKYLPNFYTQTLGSNSWGGVAELVSFNGVSVKEKAPTSKKTRISLTPKGLYEFKVLNEEGFKINCDKDYVEEQLGDLREKLSLVKVSEGDYMHGVVELQSIVMRMENRIKYPQFEEYYKQFPYTKTEKIESVLKANDALKLGLSEQFVPDFPKDAVAVMKEYKETTFKLCGKYPIFYVIAVKEDFEVTNKRKDPILLAQSPFGHFWQILGAWDKEMILLDDL